jgi:SPP1 gp7 family putative phage head morphogenesis protein
LNFSPQRRAEQDYYSKIMEILRQYDLAPYVDRDTLMDLWAREAAEQMALERYKSNSRSWREAAQEALRGQLVRQGLEGDLTGPIGERVAEIVDQNAKLISSLPEAIAQLASEEMLGRARRGQRADEPSTMLSRIARWQARRLARTEIAKAQSAITQARAEDMDLPWYAWRTVKDERVRPSHRRMEGVLVRWDDSPSPEDLIGVRSYGDYAPGGIFNCRCSAEPLLRLEQVAWPHQVYSNGGIRWMTLADFRRLNHFQQPIAA